MDILTSKNAGILTIEFNRPDKKNAITAAMYQRMADALQDAETDRAVRAILFTGKPAIFTAGNDLSDFMANPPSTETSPVFQFLRQLSHASKPVVAAVSGAAVGIGTTMLMHCDHVVAGTDARFSTPFVNLGLVPEAASSLLAPRLMGHRRAFELLVMGRPFDSAAAQACGLVNAVVAPGEVDTEAMKAAREIAALPAEALAIARRLMRPAPDDIVARIDQEARLFRERLQSAEARSAFEAFMTRKR